VSTSNRVHLLAWAVAVACLGTLTAACAKGDIVLGERGGTLAPAGIGASAGAAGLDTPVAGTGGGMMVGQAGAAAGSGGAVAGVSGSGGSGGMAPEAGAAASAGMGGSAAGAAPPPTVARPSSGCGKDPDLADFSVEVYGATSTYLVDRPVGYVRTQAYPLILAFHGTNDTAEQFRQTLNLSAVAGTEAILAYPNPLNASAAWEFTRDMPLFGELLKKLKSEYCIDEDRVFALGDGAGALFTNLIGCVNADDVRAIAPLSSAPPPPGACMGNPAVMLVQSTADPAMLGPGLGNRDMWAMRNSCDVRVRMPVSPMPCVEYGSCVRSAPVRYCEHDGDRLPSFAASGAWDFFKSL
jgi:polyhydroxybutyrate depolymerase